MKKGSQIAIATLAILVLGLLFMQTPLMKHARSTAWTSLSLFIGSLFGVGDQNISDETLSQIQVLRAQNVSLKSEVRDYRRLRSQLGSTTIDSVKNIPATVLARPIDTFNTEYILTKGIRDGVQLGAPVVLYNSILIGFISNVEDKTSTVTLLINPTTNITVESLPIDEGGVPGKGLLEGRYYTSIAATTIPRNVTLERGQAFVTVAKEQIPYGLVVGTVATVTNKENEPYQEATLTLPYKPDDLSAVTILSSP